MENEKTDLTVLITTKLKELGEKAATMADGGKQKVKELFDIVERFAFDQPADLAEMTFLGTLEIAFVRMPLRAATAVVRAIGGALGFIWDAAMGIFKFAGHAAQAAWGWTCSFAKAVTNVFIGAARLCGYKVDYIIVD